MKVVVFSERQHQALAAFRQRWALWVLPLLPFSLLVDVMGTTGFVFSRNSLADQYDISVEDASWALSAYALTYGSFIMVMGRVGDAVGHRRMYVAGMLVMAVCSLILATVQNVFVLFIFRAFQGIGAAMTSPNSAALISINYKGRVRDIGLALVGTLGAMGAFTGILLGGVFSSTAINYRGFMYLMLGLCLLAAVLVQFMIPETKGTNFHNIFKLDFPGALMVVTATVLVVLGFTDGPGHFRDAIFIAPLIAGVFMVGVFGVYQLYICERYFGIRPLFPRALWTYRNFIPIISTCSLVYGFVNTPLFAASIWFVQLGHDTPLQASIKSLAFCTTFGVSSVVAGQVVSRLPARWIMTFACLLGLLGGICLLFARVSQSYWHAFFPSFVLTAFGGSMYVSCHLNAASSGAPLEHAGTVVGIVLGLDQIGIALTSAILTAIMGDGTVEQSFVNTSYFHIGCAAVAMVVCALLVRSIQRRPADLPPITLDEADDAKHPIVDAKYSEEDSETKDSVASETKDSVASETKDSVVSETKDSVASEAEAQV